jgi:hypothetical protein
MRTVWGESATDGFLPGNVEVDAAGTPSYNSRKPFLIRFAYSQPNSKSVNHFRLQIPCGVATAQDRRPNSRSRMNTARGRC